MKMYEVKVTMVDQKTGKEHLYKIIVPCQSEGAALTAAMNLGHLVNESSNYKLKINKTDVVEIGPSVFN